MKKRLRIEIVASHRLTTVIVSARQRSSFAGASVPGVDIPRRTNSGPQHTVESDLKKEHPTPTAEPVPYEFETETTVEQERVHKALRRMK